MGGGKEGVYRGRETGDSCGYISISLNRPRMAIIGSREQLCIHPEVSKKDTNFEKVSVLPPDIFGHINTHHTYIHTYIHTPLK